MSLYRPVEIGKVSLPGNIFLAPVAGYSDRAFRSVCVEQGADFTCTELVSSEALTRDSRKTEALIRRADNEKIYAVQLFGSDPDTMAKATALLAPFRPEVVDLNCGCPVPKVIKTGAGAALSRDPARLGRIVEAMVRASTQHLGGVPVTVKIRSGWDGNSINYCESARIAVEAGAVLVALHARTRVQGYAGKADWSHIADLVTRIQVPVIGSGDLFSPEAAERMLRETLCAGLMFARGAMGNPFIFAETKDLLLRGSYEPVPSVERMRTAIRQLELLTDDAGEEFACREMRKQFCAYSKGIPGGAAVRNKLVRAATISEYREILALANMLPDSSVSR
ncbi:MAG: tRNA dihydrouridine synthase DusB [Treponemataceae bacterium]